MKGRRKTIIKEKEKDEEGEEGQGGEIFQQKPAKTSETPPNAKTRQEHIPDERANALDHRRQGQMSRLRNGLLVEEGVKESDSLLDLIEDQRPVDDTTPTRTIAPRRRAWPDVLIARMDDPPRQGIRPRRNVARPPRRLAHPSTTTATPQPSALLGWSEGQRCRTPPRTALTTEPARPWKNWRPVATYGSCIACFQ